MLSKCLPDFTYKESDHNFCIWGGGRVYPALPKGPHKRNKAEIQIGHVRKLVRHFDIMDCAKGVLPQL
jgi:hypothetical protein